MEAGRAESAIYRQSRSEPGTGRGTREAKPPLLTGLRVHVRQHAARGPGARDPSFSARIR